MTRTIVVAGGLGTLGRAVAADLKDRGYAVAIVDRAPALAENEAAVVLGDVDLTDEGAVEAAYATVVERAGSIGGLVNVAGGFVWQPVEGGSAESWERMYLMNLRTAVVSSRAALPHLLAGGGAIVNVGAAAVERPGAGMAPYAASKAGVRALTESLAEELRGRGVRVNAVQPTIIDTPANRADMPDADTASWVSPAAAAAAIAMLLSDDARAVTGECVRLSLAG